MTMKLYKISQTEYNGFDTFDSAVVCALDEKDAGTIHPGGSLWGDRYTGWCSSPEKVTVKYLGEADASIQRGVVCASFNAG